MQLLQTPVRIGSLTLKNRLVMAPMATGRYNDDGTVTDELCAYYAARAKDLGLIITEHAYISPEGQASPGQLSVHSDADIPGLRRLADAVHAADGKIFLQISHAGGAARREVTGLPALAPSAVSFQGPKANGIVMTPETPADLCPRPFTEEELRQLVQHFADAARRAKKAGFDGVEIHSAHAYLLDQFYSPLLNHRDDAYGGTLENRVRIHLEIIEAVRAAVGADYPVALRLGASDYAPGGATIEDGVAAAKLFAAAGIDLIDISGGTCSYTRPGHRDSGTFADASQAVREAVSIPVLTAGGVKTGEAAEALLQSGVADLIGVGRSLIADADWATKALASLS